VLVEIALDRPTEPLATADVWRRYGGDVAKARGRAMWGRTQPNGPRWWSNELSLLPEAHAIVLLRDPLAIAASFVARDWGVLWRGGPYPLEVRTAAAAFVVRGFIEPLAEAIRNLPDIRRTVVRLEELTSSPGNVMQVLTPVIGEQDWDAAVEGIGETPIARRAARLGLRGEGGLHEGLSKRMSPSVATRSRDRLTASQTRILQQLLGDTARRLGYPVEVKPPAPTTDDARAIRRARRVFRGLRTARALKEGVGGRLKWSLSAMPSDASRRVLGDRVPSEEEWTARSR
jgi:hypothetical protein